MRKWLILGLILVVLVGAAVLAVANLNRYLNSNRDWLAAQASSKLGRSITFEEIGVSLWGGLGARVTGLRVAEDPAFGKGDFVQVKHAAVRIKLLPALFGRYEISRIDLDAPAVTVVRTRRGFSFETLGRSAAATKPAEAGTTTVAPPSASPASGEVLPLVVALLRIRDGRLHLLDRTALPPSEFTVEHLDFSAGNVGLDTPVSLDLAAAVLGARKRNVRVSGTVGPLAPAKGAGADVPLAVKLTVGPLVINELKKTALIGPLLPTDLSAAEPLTIHAEVSGTVAAPAAKVSFDATGAQIAYGAQFVKPKGLRFQLDADVAQSETAITANRVLLRLADAEIEAKGTVQTAKPPRVDLRVVSKALPLRGWDRMLPAASQYETSGSADLDLQIKGAASGGKLPQLHGTLALRDVSVKQAEGAIGVQGLSTTIAFRGDRIEVPPARFVLGGEQAQVEAAVRNLQQPKGTFAFESAALHPAALGAGGGENDLLREVAVRGSFRTAAEGPELDATITSPSGTLEGIAYEKLDGVVAYRRQRLTLKKVSVQALDGSSEASGYYDSTDARRPQFALDANIQGMNLGAFLASYFPSSAQPIDGRLHTQLRLTGTGTTWSTIRETLKGKGAAEIKDGMLKGVNLADGVLTNVTGVPGLTYLVSPRIRGKYPVLFGGKDTAFDALRGNIDISEGAVVIKDLNLTARDFGLSGTGKVKLTNEIDFSARLTASAALTSDVLKDVSQAKYLTNSAGRLEIPFRLKGMLPRVRPQPDREFIVRALTRAVLGKGLERLLGGRSSARQATPHPERELPAGKLGESLERLFRR